jgi:putative ABC transport system permease protein
MFTHYLKIALRNLLRNKLSSIINIIGLSISTACCILIIYFIKYELSYDKYNKFADRIFRFTYSVKLNTGYNAHFARCATKWINYIPDEFPQVEKMVTIMPDRHITLKVKDEKITLLNSFFADSTFFNVFSIKLLRGDSNKVLSAPNTAVISKSFAKRYFGKENPIGQSLTRTGFYDGKKWTKIYYTITGVFEDIPSNAHFHSDLFVSKATLTWNTDWEWKYVYLLFYKNAKPEDFLSNFRTFLNKHSQDESNVKDIVPHLQCITDIHLKSNKDREIESNGNMMVIYIMGLVGLIVLIISWINYLNLSIAGVYSRTRNLSLYKIHGSPNTTILFIYLIETFIITFIAFNVAYIFIHLFFPTIKIITGNVLNEQMFQYANGVSLWCSLIFIISIIVGCTPAIAFVIRSKKSLSLIKPENTVNKPSSFFRKSLIVFQFALTVFLIISALSIYSQGKYNLNHQTGAKQDSVLVIKLFNQDILSKYMLLKNELQKSSYIKEATGTFEDPYDITMDAMGFETAGIRPENKEKILWVYAVDDNYFKFLNIPIVAGNDFPPFNEILKKEYYIINETAAKELGWKPEEAIGKPFKLKFTYAENVIFGGEIVGVVKDFNLNTLHHQIKPFVFFQKEIWFWNMLVKVDTAHRQVAIDFLKRKWNEILPDYPFTYDYNTDMYFEAYKKEIIQSRLTGFFSLLAIIISCLGLFAVSSIIILKRTKEIGIRKVNGAETISIMNILLKEFSIWVLIAIIIACPIAYYVMQKWLENFAYKITLEWWVFVFAGLSALLVALLTVSWQSWKVASSNPVEALRYE